jgi:hypothetical protein
MSRIFKQGSFEQELLEGMQSAQYEAISNKETYNERIIVQAMEHLNAAAETFESNGSNIRAAEVTQLMTAIAKGDKKSKKINSKKSSSKDEAKKVFRFFGFSSADLGDHSDGGDGEGE